MSGHAPVSSSDVPRARRFALEAHGDQRYGDQPYVVHLDAVADVLEPYGPAAQVVGYLHDVVEDTPVTLDTVRSEFGDLVARCVALVTDVPGGTRADRKRATNAKLAAVQGEERLALVVKAADRLANVRASVLNGVDEKFRMYRDEQAAFREAAHRPGLCDALWDAIGLILSREP